MSNYNAVKMLLTNFSGTQRIINIPKVYVDIFEDLNTAVILNQIIYWSDKTKRTDGYFYKTYVEWKEETGLSEYKVRRAVNALKKEGLVETDLKKANGSPTLHYRLDMENFSEWILKKLKNGNLRNLRMETEETKESLTEITTETTTEITTERGKYPAAAQTYYENHIGMIKPMVLEDLQYYAEKFDEPDAIIQKAIDIAISRSAKNWGYVKGILRTWQQEGLKTLEAVDAFEDRRNKKTNDTLNIDEL